MDLVTPSFPFVFFLWIFPFLTMLSLGIIRSFWVELRPRIESLTTVVHSIFLVWSCFYLITKLFEFYSMFFSGMDYTPGFVFSSIFLPPVIAGALFLSSYGLKKSGGALGFSSFSFLFYCGCLLFPSLVSLKPLRNYTRPNQAEAATGKLSIILFHKWMRPSSAYFTALVASSHLASSSPHNSSVI
jgi:hypothetical protein